jgi:hypothetical protein
VDGIRLNKYRPGRQYVLGNTLGALFLAEGWAEPVEDDEPAPPVPPTKYLDDKHAHELRLPNLIREIYPPYYDASPALAADRPRIKRPKRPGSRSQPPLRRVLQQTPKKN